MSRRKEISKATKPGDKPGASMSGITGPEAVRTGVDAILPAPTPKTHSRNVTRESLKRQDEEFLGHPAYTSQHLLPNPSLSAPASQHQEDSGFSQHVKIDVKQMEERYPKTRLTMSQVRACFICGVSQNIPIFRRMERDVLM